MEGGPGSNERRPFDDFFVQAAPRVEPSAQERIAQADRIARAHEQAAAWRVSGPAYPGPFYPPSPPPYYYDPPRKRGPRAIFVLALVVALCAGALRFQGQIRTWVGANVPDSPIAGARVVPAGEMPGPDSDLMPAEDSPTPLGTPIPAPAGVGGYQFLNLQTRTGEPVAFDPCRPIHFVVRPDGEIPGGRDILLEAISEISHVTGLVFIDDGSTTEAPSDDRAAYQRDRYGDRWAPVLIVWSDAGESPRLAGAVAGYAGPEWTTGTSKRDGISHYVTGQVVLDSPDLMQVSGRSTGRAQVKAIILHELGHLVGLDHVNDRRQIMYPTNVGTRTYMEGDLRGLYQLGLGHCFHGR